jgi:hypothetical protein
VNFTKNTTEIMVFKYFIGKWMNFTRESQIYCPVFAVKDNLEILGISDNLRKINSHYHEKE